MIKGKELLKKWVVENRSVQHALAYPSQLTRNHITGLYDLFVARNFDFVNLYIGLGKEGLKTEGWIGIDVCDIPGLDLIVSTTTLPFKDGVVNHIDFRNIIEHLPRYETDIAVEELHRVLKPGGDLNIQAPSIIGLVKRYLENPTEKNHFRMMNQMHGPQHSPGEFHYTSFTTKEAFRCFVVDHGFEFMSWVALWGEEGDEGFHGHFRRS